MKNISHFKTTMLAERLKEKISPHLSDKLNQSSLVVDLADSYEACSRFIAAVDGIVSVKHFNREKLETFLVEVDVQLLEHLGYHLKLLRKNVPKAMEQSNEID